MAKNDHEFSEPVDVPPAGNDFQSRRRQLKTQLAAAESTGDADAGKAARSGLADLDKELRAHEQRRQREVAAEARQSAAEGDAEARTRSPVGRAAPAKATTQAKN